VPSWRQDVDLPDVEAALAFLEPLLDAVYVAGSSMLLRVDAERRCGANPARFTVAISGNLVFQTGGNTESTEFYPGTSRSSKLRGRKKLR
jgi:hypothetical protein